MSSLLRTIEPDGLGPASREGLSGRARMSPRRYQSLDHWRGLACLLVVVYHSTILHLALDSRAQVTTSAESVIEWFLVQTHTFNVGVALFFVISGYCIAAAADSARRRSNSVRWYFIRRFRRIYPPLWIVMICSVVFFLLVDFRPFAGLLSHEPWMQPRPFWYSPSQWFGNITLTETWRYHLFGSPRAHFPGQAWTLCYEEQFYLITGLLLAFCPSAFFRGIAAVTILTFVAVISAAMLSVPIDGLFLDGSWFLFAAGVAVYYRVNYATGISARLVDLVLLVSIPTAWILNAPIYGTIIGFCFAALLPLLYSFDHHIASARFLRPFQICGQMCYSLYLVHQLPVKAVTAGLHAFCAVGPWPTLLLTVPASIAVSVALGWAFHVTVERRFLNVASSRSIDSLPLPSAVPIPRLAVSAD